LSFRTWSIHLSLLVVGPGGVSTGRWVVHQETGRRGSGGPYAAGRLVTRRWPHKNPVLIHRLV